MTAFLSTPAWVLGLCLGLALSVVSLTPLLAQDPMISEFLAANGSGLRDGDGDSSDWIEIFNPSANEVALEDWSLTDDPDALTKWRFPAVMLPGHAFLIVFASGNDRTDPDHELHTNFSLNRDGEYLALVGPDGLIATEFAPAYPSQFEDVSFGRQVEIAERVLLAAEAPARLLVPEDASIDDVWMATDFDDASWTRSSGGVGYDLIGPPPRELSPGDASAPTDSIVGTSFNSPNGEEVDKAIDGSSGTKYLNFDKFNAGLTVTLSRGATAVTGLKFTSANDVPDRDPTSYVLSGSSDNSTFTEIASGTIPDFSQRFETVEVAFENPVAYTHYRLIFPTIRNPNSVAMQIAEVEFTALVEAGVDATIEGEDITQPGDALDPTSFNSPVGEDVNKAIDNDPRTKYLNFDTLNAGFTVTPAGGVSVVQGLRLTSANDAPDRDPTSFTLEGSNDGNDFAEIASGPLPNFSGRFTTVAVSFTNNSSYPHYRLRFPTVRQAGTNAMQIAEVEFLGDVGAANRTFAELIGTEVAPPFNGAYLRIPFELAIATPFGAPVLQVWSDDGFIAYLNGTEVARTNAPADSRWDSNAVSDRSREDAVRRQSIDLVPFVDGFVDGSNLLAIHALNDASDSEEFLLRAEIVDTQLTIGSDDVYFTSPTPGAANPVGFRGIASAPAASVDRGFFEDPFQLTLTTTTEDATIRYTTDGSEPTEDHGADYSGPLTLAATTVLRAAAFREGWAPSPATTHSYIFAADVITQSRQSALAAGFPDRWNNQPADYGLDPFIAVRPAELVTLPSISLVIEPDDMFGRAGIYANPNVRGNAWERKVSFEWLDPAGSESFQEHAGIRIQGGAFRRFDLTLKKSFRLIFRERYGSARLRRSLFGPEAAAEADSIVLRANGNDAWKWGGDSALYIRDAFVMNSMRAMGNVASHSAFAHLYINGHYWGLYNPTERPDAAFSSIYHGGETASWDALNQDSVPDGTADAWNRLLTQLNAGLASDANYQRVQGNNPDGTRNPDYEVLLDIDNLIDYMILNFYIGNGDWPGRNHWYGRNRDGDQGFQFYPWDSETSMGLNSGVNANRIDVSNAVARPFAAARANAEFRIRFGDRVHKHFFNGGTFASDQPAQRFAALASTVDAAIAGESARWGDQLGSTRFTRQRHWRVERDDVLNDYFPRRSAIVLDQLRAARLYPRVDAPVFNQHGGAIAEGLALTITANKGTIVYTVDGSDPRFGNAVPYTVPVVLNRETTVKARALSDGAWSALVEATFAVPPNQSTATEFAIAREGNQLILTYPAKDGVSRELQTSNDLANWLLLQQLPPGAAGQALEVRLPIENDDQRRFFRLLQKE